MSMLILDGPGAVVKTQPPSQSLTQLELMKRLKIEELRNILDAAETNIDMKIWMEKFRNSSEIVRNDPETIKGFEDLERLGMIAEGRAKEILSA